MQQTIVALYLAQPVTFVVIVLALMAGSTFLVCFISEWLPRSMVSEWREEAASLSVDYPDWQLPKYEPKPIELSVYALSRRHKTLVFVLVVALTCVALYCGETVLDAGYYVVLLLSMLTITSINFKHHLIPDVIVQALQWLGLLYHATIGDDLSQYLLGVAIGYGSLYLLLWLVRWRTDKEFFGYGDIKSIAMLGAWFGISQLPFLFIVSIAGMALTGVAAAILRKSAPVSVVKPVPTGASYLLACVVGVLGIVSF